MIIYIIGGLFTLIPLIAGIFLLQSKDGISSVIIGTILIVVGALATVTLVCTGCSDNRTHDNIPTAPVSNIPDSHPIVVVVVGIPVGLVENE